jgi:hypothetical protein
VAFVPDWAIDRMGEVSRTAWALYTKYCKHADSNGVAWPKLDRCATEMGVNYSHLSVARKELIECGFIEKLDSSTVRLLNYSKDYLEKPKVVLEIPKQETETPLEIPNNSLEKPNIQNGQPLEIPKPTLEKPNTTFGKSKVLYRNNQPIEPAQLTSPHTEPPFANWQPDEFSQLDDGALRDELAKIIRKRTATEQIRDGTTEKKINTEVAGVVNSGGTLAEIAAFEEWRQRPIQLGYYATTFVSWRAGQTANGATKNGSSTHTHSTPNPGTNGHSAIDGFGAKTRRL